LGTKVARLWFDLLVPETPETLRLRQCRCDDGEEGTRSEASGCNNHGDASEQIIV
jgi:hypothetical protein